MRARRGHPDDASAMFAAIIPTYQREALIRRAVESVLTQTTRPIEVIVVDDGSTDGTLAVLDSYRTDVRVVSQPQSGSAAARNRGVGEATAEWVAFLDSDDEWKPDHLDRIATAIAATDGAADLYFRDTAVALGRLGTSDTRGRSASLWSRAGFDVDGAVLVGDGSSWVISATQPMTVSSSVVRRARYLEVGGMWPALRLRHDTHLFFKLGLGRPVCAVAGVGATLTADASDTSLTRDVTPLARPYWDETVLMYDDLLRCVASPPIRRELRERLATAHWRLARIASAEHRPKGAFRALARTSRTKPSYVPRRVVGVCASGLTALWHLIEGTGFIA